MSLLLDIGCYCTTAIWSIHSPYIVTVPYVKIRQRYRTYSALDFQINTRAQLHCMRSCSCPCMLGEQQTVAVFKDLRCYRQPEEIWSCALWLLGGVTWEVNWFLLSLPNKLFLLHNACFDRVLEIGPGPGTNFKCMQNNTRITEWCVFL